MFQGGGAAEAKTQVVTLPGDLILIQQVCNGWPINSASRYAISSITAAGGGDKRESIRNGWSKNGTEIIATECEGVRYSIIILQVGAIIVAQGFRAVGRVKSVHGPFIPFTMNGLPGMRDVTKTGKGVRYVLRSDGAAVAIRLGIVRRDAK